MPAHELPDTVNRVRRHTTADINQRIERQLERDLAYYAQHPERIQRRLFELDREWDIERAIQANAATLGLVGFALASLRGRRFLVLPVAVSAFLLQHALQGWCPPVPVLRRLGFRTAHEIERERYALKAVRGDFERTREGDVDNRVRSALEAVSAREALTSPSVAPST